MRHMWQLDYNGALRGCSVDFDYLVEILESQCSSAPKNLQISLLNSLFFDQFFSICAEIEVGNQIEVK